MNAAFLSYMAGVITREELHRFQELNTLLFGGAKFAVIDGDMQQEWSEYSVINAKICGVN